MQDKPEGRRYLWTLLFIREVSVILALSIDMKKLQVSHRRRHHLLVPSPRSSVIGSLSEVTQANYLANLG